MLRFPPVLYKHFNHVISNFSVKSLLSKIIGTSDRFLDSDGNTLYLVLLSLGFLKGNFAGFWGTQERFSFFYPSICLRKKKICGSWQECFCKVVGEHSEQYLSQN